MVSESLTAAIIATLVPELVCMVRASGKKIALAVLTEIVERAIEKEIVLRMNYEV
jgi:hypothetical protein